MNGLDIQENGLLDLLSRLLSEHGQFIEIGAGVGSSAIFLKMRFPSANVLAVEALASVFAVLERNCKGCAIETRRATVSNVTSAPSFIGSFELGSTTTLDELASGIQSIELLKISTDNLGTDTIRKARDTLVKTSILTLPVSMHLVALEKRHGHTTADVLQTQIDQLGFPFVYCLMDGADLVQVDHVEDFASVLEGTDGDNTLVLSRAPIPAITVQGYLFKMLRQEQAQHEQIKKILRDGK